jgi:hypothetical protein
LAGLVGSIVADEDWVEVRTAIVAVLADEGRRLQQVDESLRFGAGGARMRNGEVACWLTVSRPEAVDPHMETTVGVSGVRGAYRMRIDIGTFEGEVLAEFEDPDDRPRTLDEMVTTLRRFLDDNSGLLERLATT